MHTPQANIDQLKGGSSAHRTLILLTLTASVFIVSYVETMILPAVPQIQKDFSSTVTTASWITSIVLLVGAASSPLFGKLGDVHGKKKMILLAFSFYTLGVALAGFAPSMSFLLFARALQGVGFAVLPLALAMVTDSFPKEKLATAQGTIAGAAAISATAGLVLGSYIVESLGWREAFYSALVLSVIFLVLASKFLKESSRRSKSSVDYLGSLLLIGGITLILLYLTEGSSLGWASLENSAILISGLALTVFFFFFEKGRRNPLIALSLLRIRNILVANLVTIISGLGNFLMFYAFVYYAELPKSSGLGLSELSTGLALAPATLVMLVAGPVSGKAVSKIGPRPIMVSGSLILVAGFALFAFDRATELSVTLDAIVAMTGIIAIFVPVVNMISVALPKDVVAVGQGLNSTLKNVGAAIGPVLATALMSTSTESSSGLPSATAFDYIFLLGIFVTVAVLGLSFAGKNYVFKKTEERIISGTETGVEIP